MIPIYFLENGEANADENFARLCEFTTSARRFKSVGTIFQSHKAIAESVAFPMFFVVDADAWIVDDFEFPVFMDLQPKTVGAFRARNPVNGLVYGHGAVKVFTVDCFVGIDQLDRPDMSSTIAEHYKVIHTLSNEHRFATDGWNTWRTAFREVVKLASGINKNNKNDETLKRLKVWTTSAEGDFAEQALAGAKTALAYVQQHQTDVAKLSLVNDYKWLKEQYNAAF